MISKMSFGGGVKVALLTFRCFICAKGLIILFPSESLWKESRETDSNGSKEKCPLEFRFLDVSNIFVRMFILCLAKIFLSSVFELVQISS